MENYPVFAKNKFICPHCSTLAKQDWFENNDLNKIINNLNCSL